MHLDSDCKGETQHFTVISSVSSSYHPSIHPSTPRPIYYLFIHPSIYPIHSHLFIHPLIYSIHPPIFCLQNGNENNSFYPERWSGRNEQMEDLGYWYISVQTSKTEVERPRVQGQCGLHRRTVSKQNKNTICRSIRKMPWCCLIPGNDSSLLLVMTISLVPINFGIWESLKSAVIVTYLL